MEGDASNREKSQTELELKNSQTYLWTHSWLAENTIEMRLFEFIPQYNNMNMSINTNVEINSIMYEWNGLQSFQSNGLTYGSLKKNMFCSYVINGSYVSLKMDENFTLWSADFKEFWDESL